MQARLSLHLSKCHIVGHLVPRLIWSSCPPPKVGGGASCFLAWIDVGVDEVVMLSLVQDLS